MEFCQYRSRGGYGDFQKVASGTNEHWRWEQSSSVLLRICKEAHMHTHHITPSREYVGR